MPVDLPVRDSVFQLPDGDYGVKFNPGNLTLAVIGLDLDYLPYNHPVQGVSDSELNHPGTYTTFRIRTTYDKQTNQKARNMSLVTSTNPSDEPLFVLGTGVKGEGIGDKIIVGANPDIQSEAGFFELSLNFYCTSFSDVKAYVPIGNHPQALSIDPDGTVTFRRENPMIPQIMTLELRV